MKQISLILFLFVWPLSSCQEILDFSNACGKCTSVPCSINVGLLAGLTGAEETALRQALTVINSQTSLYPKWEIWLTVLGQDNRQLLREWTQHKLFSIITDQLLSSKLSVLIGPGSSVVVEWIHSLLVMLNITHIAPLASNPTFLDPGRFPNLIRMVPDDNYQVQAVISLLEYFQYLEMSLLTSDDEYGLSIVEIFRHLRRIAKVKEDLYSTKGCNLRKVVRLRIPANKTEIRFNLQQIRKSKPHLVVLATDRLLGHTILTEAYRMSMTAPRGWLWLAMDVMTSVPFENIRINGKALHFPELLGLRPRVDTHKVHERLNLTHLTNISFTVERYIDGFLLVADRIKQTCDGNKEMKNGTSQSIPYFIHQDSSLPVIYDIMQSNYSDWSVIGEWSYDNQPFKEQLIMANGSRSIRRKDRLNIVTGIEAPFVYFENESETDPLKLQGYCIDMLKEFSKLANFDYDLYLVQDTRWGAINRTTGQWNGMIGDVVRGVADMAVATMTVTEERAAVVDFLPPYLRLELKFLVKRDLKSNAKYNAFAFLDPFDFSLYRAILISVFSLPVFVSFLSAASPFGIRGSFFQSKRADAAKRYIAKSLASGLLIPERTKQEKRLLKQREEAGRGMGLNNSLYLFWAALFCQSPERVPRSISAKVVAISWYVAATVFVSSYTANLVMSVSRVTQEVDFIRSPEDLMMQTMIGFGTINGTAMENQLRVSDTNLARKMYNAINGDQSPLGYWVNSSNLGFGLVRAGKYAMIWDSISLDFMVEESECALKAVSLGFGSIQYAFAIPKSISNYGTLSTYITTMKESGFLKELWDKYFDHLEGCSHLETTGPKSRQLTFTDKAGVFILVGAVMTIGCFFMSIEWIIAAFADMTSMKPSAPRSLGDALRIRGYRVSLDVRVNWFPFHRIHRMIDKWRKLRVSAESLTQQSLKRLISRRSDQIKDEVHHGVRLSSSSAVTESEEQSMELYENSSLFSKQVP